MTHPDFQADFYFIRHGESESNVAPGLAAGVNFDAPMTERGHKQAFALGKRLASEGRSFDRIYSSSLLRAVQTTQEMLRGMGVGGTAFEQSADIIERQVPEWRGRPVAEVHTPEVLLLMAENGKWFKPGDGESHREVERRFSNWLEDELLFNNEFVGRPGRQTVAIVSHGLALQCLFHYIMGFNDSLIDRIPLNNTSISRFRFNRHGWFPVSINDASHTEELGDILREGTRGWPM
ncbi:MAG: histidine phosphatase family protein [Chloroflexi bacterium]|nr:histidine phosphatase family protein [Chloroflexota bacterium]